MKVCLYTHYSYTYQDGATLSLINIANELVERGNEVIIVIPNKNIKFPINNNKVKCIVIPSMPMRVPLNARGFKIELKGFIKNVCNWFSTRKSLSVLRNEKPDIIHINGVDSNIGAQTAIKLGIPYIWHIRQFLKEDLGLRVYNEDKTNNLLKSADSIIAISKAIQENFQEVLDRELDLVYNGVPIDKYKMNKIQRFSSKTTKILLAGRFVEQKGQLDAVKAVGHIVKKGNKNIRLVLAGNAQNREYTESINKYIAENKIEEYVQIIDHMEDLRKLRLDSDIGLICSKKEAFGRVTVETMLSRMLTIGADTAGTAEIIEDNVSGLLYKEGNYLSLANRIESAISNKKEMNEIINRGYDIAIEKYSITRVVDQITAIYKNVTSKS